MRQLIGKVLEEECPRRGLGATARLSCRFTHVYPDGPAPYYSFSGVAAPGSEAELWQHIKDTATRAVVDVVASNRPPTANAGPDITANEGDLVTFSGSFTDPDGTANATVSWEFGDGATARTSRSTSPAGTTLKPRR